MRPGLVEVEHIHVKHTMELLLLQDEQMIEALAPYTAQKPFTHGIHSRSVTRYCENLDVTCLRNPCEDHPELAIMITDEVLRPHTIGGGLPQLLCGPRVGRTSCDADMHHFARVQFDDEERKKRTEEQISDWQEITGPDLLSMGVEEGFPVLSSWPGSARLSHVFLDRACADAQTQLE